jgi:O-methyltransferase
MNKTLLSPHKFELLRKHSISVNEIEGDVIEVGLYRGGSFAMLCEINPSKHVYGFDTFEGLPQHSPEDNKHVKGEFSNTSKEIVESLVSHLNNHTVQKGRFPQDINIDLSDKKFSLVHIDVDLYQEHINILNFMYDKVSNGGRIVFDDYNHANCLGAKKAVDLFFKDKPEEIIISNTSQAYIVKK